MPFIETIPPDRATGELREVYRRVQEQRGAVANVLQIESLHPKALEAHLNLYMSILYGSSGLTRQERETIAVSVSQANGCRYCAAHHAEALGRYQKDLSVIQGLQRNGTSEGLTEREAALVAFSRRLTLEPASGQRGDIDRLRGQGLSDEEILMATLVTSYFNYVNRVVHGLGVEIETKTTGTYKY